MNDPDGLLVEERSKFSILLIEDNPDFLTNAVRALRGHIVIPATTMEKALLAIKKVGVDMILSDVHLPNTEKDEPRENTECVLLAAVEVNIPVCFVTQADHHGLVESDEGYISIRALTPDDALISLVRPQNGSLFRNLQTTQSKTIRMNEKTVGIWSEAFEMLKNVSTKAGTISSAMKQVRDATGLSFTVKDGRPLIKLPKK